jgi:benzoate-CoA ligase family protein
VTSFASFHLDVHPPRVSFPRRYNAAVDLLDRHLLEGRGQRLAYIDDRTRLTYQELAERVARAGHAFARLGVLPEQRVMLAMLDTVDLPVVFLGAIRTGRVPVPVNTLLAADDYVHLLCDSRARVLVVSDVLLEKLRPAIAAARQAGHLQQVVVASSPSGPPPAGLPEGADAWLDALLTAASPDAAGPAAAATSPDEPAFWLYSSGSTGKPKGAVHLHAHLAQTAALYAHGILGIRPDDVVFSAAKLFFAYGLGNALTFPLQVGATAVLMAERPTPASVLRTLRQYRPTLFFGVPTLFAALLADPAATREAMPDTLRLSISAGEALPAHVGLAWKERFGTDILDGIGSTEMLHIFLSNRPGDVRYGTSGKPVPGYDVELRAEDGGPVADGDEGGLWVRGPSSAVAYWNDRERSLSTFHGPWTRTGDRYARDADGYYTYVGRGDDMLKVGGIWVSPFEVESALGAHAAVLEVAVVGHPDADGLIKPKAFVVPRHAELASAELAAELQRFVKERLAPYKYPRWIEFRTELPRTATGKLQRFRLRG